MKDFASFTPSGGGDWMREAEALMKQYEGKGERELVQAIYARAVEGKKNGTLTNDQIDAFYAQLSPMLDGVRLRRLKKLVEELKSM